MEYQPQKRRECFKSPSPEKTFIVLAAECLSPEACRKRMFLVQAWVPLFYGRTAGQTPLAIVPEKRAQVRRNTRRLSPSL